MAGWIWCHGILPSGSLQVFVTVTAYASGKNVREVLCEVTARELFANLVAAGG